MNKLKNQAITFFVKRSPFFAQAKAATRLKHALERFALDSRRLHFQMTGNGHQPARVAHGGFPCSCESVAPFIPMGPE
jgi:acyl-coenzyme A thioesterase PaaI-like protein